MKTIPTLGYKNYTSDQNLLKRLAFAKHCQPKVNIVKEIFRFLQLGKAASQHRLLDVGCGNGQDLIKIKQYGFRGKLCGLDVSAEMLNKARRLNRRERAGIDFILGNIENLDLPDNAFDSVIVKHVLHNVYNHNKALRECHRVLKRGGKLAIAVNEKKTRILFRKLKPGIARLLKIDFFPDADKHINSEILKPILKRIFKKFTVFKFQSEVRLKKPQPYLDYIDSGRNFWRKTTDTQWQRVLDFARQYFEKVIAKKGTIRDYVTVSVIIAEKES